MKVEQLAVIKEKMITAKKQGKEDEFKKYFNMFSEGYKEITGKDFEEEIRKSIDESKKEKKEEQER